VKQQLSLGITLVLGVLALQGCAENRAPAPAPLANSTPPETSSSPQTEARTAAAPVLASPMAAAPAESSSPQSLPPVATLRGEPVSMERLNQALLEGYGLNMLVIQVQLDYTKQVAANDKIVVTQEDIDHERDITFATQFADADKSEYPMLFEQLLKNTHTSKVEWQILFETNAYIRKMIEPLAKAQISDDNLQLAFRQLYGETVQVRHIEVGNMAKVVEVKRRLATGEPFEKVAMDLSENAHTAPLGGELPPFSRASNVEQIFKDTAFDLKEGEVSNPVQMGTKYEIIKLEHRIAPKAVKFEDVKDSIREDLTARFVQANMEKRRGELRDLALRSLIIENPTLKAQYEEQLQKRDQQIVNRNEIQERWIQERDKILQAASQPATRPTPNGSMELPPLSPNPNAASEVARPPATQSGAR
jgi:parvulin-like peptidyl-prolyl isomerase